MKPPKRIIEAASANGSIDYISQLVSAVQILNCEANSLMEEANDIMELNHLSIGMLKKLHGDFTKAADRYFKAFAECVCSEEQKLSMFRDVDDFDKVFREWAKFDKERRTPLNE